jgi:ribose transport system permease protein
MPKLMWREPIETTTIRVVRNGDDASAAAARAAAKPKVTTLGSIAGRESGVLVVLLVVFGALTLLSDDFLTGNNLANLASSRSVS